MSAIIQVTAEDPDDLLGLFGAGAVIRWEYSPDNGVQTPYAEGGTVALVEDTFTYSIFHLAGTPTMWYRTRYSTATPAVGTDYSGYSTAFQPDSAGDYVTPSILKAQMAIDDTLDDAAIWPICDWVNRELHGIIGVFVGPSSDTVRTYDGSDAVGTGSSYRTGTRLWIPGGIRTCTLLETAVYGGTFASVASTAWHLGPNIYGRPSQPYGYVEFLPYVSAWPWFPYGGSNVRITGTFGPAASPADLTGVAVALATRKLQARSSGGRGIVGNGDFGNSIYPFLTGPEMAIVDRYSNEAGPLVA